MISRDKRWVKNKFKILVSRCRVLLNTMEQKPKVVRDIVLTRVVLNEILSTHQVGGARPQNLQDNLSSINEQLLCGADENFSNTSRAAKQQKPT